jgi:hypothetical protein
MAVCVCARRLAKYIEHLKAKQAQEGNAAMKAHLGECEAHHGPHNLCHTLRRTGDQIRLLTADNTQMVGDVNRCDC